MAKRKNDREPITNAVVAARKGADVLQACAGAVSAVRGTLRLIDENRDLDADRIRAMLATCHGLVEDAHSAVDWSEVNP